jgi:hypothetical protein
VRRSSLARFDSQKFTSVFATANSDNICRWRAKQGSPQPTRSDLFRSASNLADAWAA